MVAQMQGDRRRQPDKYVGTTPTGVNRVIRIAKQDQMAIEKLARWKEIQDDRSFNEYFQNILMYKPTISTE